MRQKPKTRKTARKDKKETGGAGTARAAQKEQSARFIEAAREIGVDESGAEFERALKKVAPPKKPRAMSRS